MLKGIIEIRKAFTHPDNKYMPVYSCPESRTLFGADISETYIDAFKEDLNEMNNLHVYIGRNGDGLYKVGFSGDLKQREKQIKTHNPRFNIIHKIKTPWAKGVELKLKHYLSNLNVSGEWFDIADSLISQLITDLDKFQSTQKPLDIPPDKFFNGMPVSSTMMNAKMPYGCDINIKTIINYAIKDGCDIYVYKNNKDGNYYMCLEDLEKLVIHSKFDLSELLNEYIQEV